MKHTASMRAGALALCLGLTSVTLPASGHPAPDTTNGYTLYAFNGGPCGLLEHDAATGMMADASFGEFSRYGVDCISLGANYSSVGWSGMGVMDSSTYVGFHLGVMTPDDLMLLREQDGLSFRVKRTGNGPDTLAAYFVDRYGSHQLLEKTYVPAEEKTVVCDVPVTSIPVIASFRFYAWGSEPLPTISGILSVDQVQITFGMTKVSTVSVGEETGLPFLWMSEPYPNPFNPLTMIEFTVAREGKATLAVFNAFGQQVATLFEGTAYAGTKHSVSFNASDLASGVYFARLNTGGTVHMKKLLLLK